MKQAKLPVPPDSGDRRMVLIVSWITFRRSHRSKISLFHRWVIGR
jgi:hypothetical protein